MYSMCTMCMQYTKYTMCLMSKSVLNDGNGEVYYYAQCGCDDDNVDYVGDDCIEISMVSLSGQGVGRVEVASRCADMLKFTG